MQRVCQRHSFTTWIWKTCIRNYSNPLQMLCSYWLLDISKLCCFYRNRGICSRVSMSMMVPIVVLTIVSWFWLVECKRFCQGVGHCIPLLLFSKNTLPANQYIARKSVDIRIYRTSCRALSPPRQLMQVLWNLHVPSLRWLWLLRLVQADVSVGKSSEC